MFNNNYSELNFKVNDRYKIEMFLHSAHPCYYCRSVRRKGRCQ